ncbi:MAG: hypothetical protein IKI11_03585 [Neisseriaceae bacterium]|nr:hypothetical protein [Neisseriaceae bacterium]
MDRRPEFSAMPKIQRLPRRYFITARNDSCFFRQPERIYSVTVGKNAHPIKCCLLRWVEDPPYDFFLFFSQPENII